MNQCRITVAVFAIILSSLILLMMPQDSAAVTVYEDDEAAAISAVQQLITGQDSQIQNVSKTITGHDHAAS